MILCYVKRKFQNMEKNSGERYLTFRALFFDFDGVFVETMPGHLFAWKKVLEQEYGFTPDIETIKLNEGQAVEKIAKAIFEQAHKKFDNNLIQKVVERKNQEFLANYQVAIYSENIKIINAVKKRGLKVGLVTGTKKENIRAILPAHSFQTFDVMITDGDTRLGKPHPDPYLAAANRLEIKPECCMVIENAPLGINAAKAAGMFCVALKTTLFKEHLKQADVIYNDHKELYRDIFRLINLL